MAQQTGQCYDAIAGTYAEAQEAKPFVVYFERPGLLAELPAVIGNEMSGHGHAEIFCENHSFYIRDLESTNGSARNGVRITALEGMSLAPGDRLRLGDKQLKIWES